MKLNYYNLSCIFLILTSFLLSILALMCKLKFFSLMLEWSMLKINNYDFIILFYFDWLSLLFLSEVLLITGSILLYSKSYMSKEMNTLRFILLILLFVVSMTMLVVSPNLISILLGWDGLGLVSYCLVIYYQNFRSHNGAMLTGLSNRVGDVCLLMSIGFLLAYGSWNILFLEEVSYYMLTMMSLMVVLASMTKSAQIPFSAWLPAAMAAPTPVSALVHSSTLVTAGVYLMIRFYPTIENLVEVKTFLFFSSLLTMMMAGLSACFENDLKKIIALSTLSQLGLMMMILSSGFVLLAYFHLLTHALFKAMLFMCAGKMIHINKGNQDIRFMGSLETLGSMTVVCFLTANLALSGVPFLAAFYSKDLILEAMAIDNIGLWTLIMLMVGTILTCLYSYRLTLIVFFYSWKGSSESMLEDNEKNYIYSLVFLLFGAIFGGNWLSWVCLEDFNLLLLEIVLQKMPLYLLLAAMLSGLLIFKKFFFISLMTKDSKVICEMWNMPFLSSQFLINKTLKSGYWNLKSDQTWSELVGGQGSMMNFLKTSFIFQLIQINSLKSYLLMTFTIVYIVYLMIF